MKTFQDLSNWVAEAKKVSKGNEGVMKIISQIEEDLDALKKGEKDAGVISLRGHIAELSRELQRQKVNNIEPKPMLVHRELGSFQKEICNTIPKNTGLEETAIEPPKSQVLVDIQKQNFVKPQVDAMIKALSDYKKKFIIEFDAVINTNELLATMFDDYNFLTMNATDKMVYLGNTTGFLSNKQLESIEKYKQITEMEGYLTGAEPNLQAFSEKFDTYVDSISKIRDTFDNAFISTITTCIKKIFGWKTEGANVSASLKVSLQNIIKQQQEGASEEKDQDNGPTLYT